MKNVIATADELRFLIEQSAAPRKITVDYAQVVADGVYKGVVEIDGKMVQGLLEVSEICLYDANGESITTITNADWVGMLNMWEETFFIKNHHTSFINK